MIAALYVVKDGPYSDLEGVDAWPEAFRPTAPDHTRTFQRALAAFSP